MATDEESLTAESEFLSRRPELRKFAQDSAEFNDWKLRLTSLEMDGCRYYVRGGDMLKDEDQIILEWLRRFHSGLLLDNEAGK